MPPAGFKRSRALWQRDDDSMRYYTSSAFRNALLYELQPIRWNEWTSQQDLFIANTRTFIKTATKALQRVPAILHIIWQWLSDRSVRQWSIFTAAIAYYATVRYIHYKLEAGPIVMILSALVAIFTVGLSDSRNDGLPSAYSIFNRGFASLMGSVDADALVQQHVGGGLMGAAVGAVAPPPMQDHDIDRRQQRPVVEEAEEAGGDNRDNGGNENNAIARRPRKKQGRRRNGEQRRDIQRQREAAAALGFGGANENIAMNRLVEDQM